MSPQQPDQSFDLQPLEVKVTYDTSFKFIFAVPNETEEILAQLLNDLLCLEDEQKIIELSYKNVELISERQGGRCLILDLKVKDQQGKTYNIEVQRRDSDPILTRAIYQSSRLTTEQLGQGQQFKALEPVVCVLLCNYSTYPDQTAVRVFKLVPFGLKDHEQRQPLAFKNKDFDPSTHPRYTQLKKRVTEAEKSLEHLSIYLVELDKKDSSLSDHQRMWLKFLLSSTTYPYTPANESTGDEMNEYNDYYFVPNNASEQTMQRIKEAQERLHRFAADPGKRDLYFREQLERITYNSNMSDAFERGIERGMEKGIEQGIEQGQLRQLKTTIKNMSDAGLDDEQIAMFLKLSPEKLQELKTFDL